MNYPEDNIERLISEAESILFVSGEGVTLEDFMRALSLTEESLTCLLIKLREKYNRRDSGLNLRVTSTGLKLVSKPENFEVVKKALRANRPQNLSQAAYEVLAIIAYSGPITRAELEAIRGVGSSSSLQHLLDLGLVEATGIREVIGRPFEFETTDYFLEAMGIKSKKELPEYSSFKERLKQHE